MAAYLALAFNTTPAQLSIPWTSQLHRSQGLSLLVCLAQMWTQSLSLSPVLRWCSSVLSHCYEGLWGGVCTCVHACLCVGDRRTLYTGKHEFLLQIYCNWRLHCGYITEVRLLPPIPLLSFIKCPSSLPHLSPFTTVQSLSLQRKPNRP